MRQYSRPVAKERAVRSERQLECAVASEGMSAVETQQRLVRRAVPGVDVKKNAVIGGIAQTSAPRVRRLIGEAVRQAFRHLQIHRVVSRVGGVRIQEHAWTQSAHAARKLRIGHNEILGEQSTV